jgi:membrane protein implicated in regulation of membrane protease activity
MERVMVWWLWLFLGLILLGIEVMTPGGFYILFFGLAALIVGALTGLGVVQSEPAQWLLFSLLSIGSLMVFRHPLRRLAHFDAPKDMVDSLIGESVLVLDALDTGEHGKAELRGTVWNAKNAGTVPLSKGQRGRVAKVEGLTLWIESE